MLKYRGQFRILYECDKKTDKSCEFTFIPCRIKKGSNIYRHNDDVLSAYISSAKLAHRLLKEYPDLFKAFQMGDSEATLLFNETYIERAAVILKARIMGKDLSPKPKRQIVISKERKQVLSDRMKELQSNKKNIGENARKTM